MACTAQPWQNLPENVRAPRTVNRARAAFPPEFLPDWTECSKPWGRQPGWGFHAHSNVFCIPPATSFIKSLNWNGCSCINSALLHYTQCLNSPFFLWLLVWASSSLVLSAGPSGFASGLSLIPLLLFWSDFSSFSLLFVGCLLWLTVLHCKRHRWLFLAVQLLIAGGAHFH